MILVRFQTLFCLILLLPVILMAQSQDASIRGVVRDNKGAPIPGINIVLQGAGKGAATDAEGRFAIEGIPPGTYELVISGIAYQKQTQPVILSAGQTLKSDIRLQEHVLQMDEVVVTGKSEAEKLRETGYAVEVITTKEQKNLTTNVNQMLKRTAGIHIREAGGVGSGFTLSLNGLSGNQIRYFIDGIPMENFGSALTLNNFPVNLIDNIEVYKGVVPIALGADALGGAVNITTASRRQSFQEIAYSPGSFNSHKASTNLQFANNERGHYVRLSAFFNHSDNTYRMKNVPLFDPELGNSSGAISTRRFHDDYTSGMAYLEAGLLDKKLADRWSLGFTGAFNKKNQQHPDNNINRVFGEFHTKNQTLLLSTSYRKQLEQLGLKGYIMTGRIVESVVDTSSKKYNWAGEFVVRQPDDPKGELFERRSFLELTDFVLRSNLGADYEINRHHELSLSFSQNYLKRTGQDHVNQFNRAFEAPNFIHKNLLGLAYTFKTHQERLTATAFAKQYWYNGKIITQDFQDNDVITRPALNSTGYGAVFTGHAARGLQLKASFEKTVRIPESFEILGDGIYILPNPALSPEKSHNANLGLRLGKDFKKFDFESEVNYFYRFSKDFIRFNPLGPFGAYENLNNVRSTGIEASLNINYDDFVLLNTNLTYQDLTDRTEFDEGLPNTNYKSRIPNTPYFFGNARFGINLGKKWLKSRLILYWHTRYVHEFFLTWENLGSADGKNIIPGQLTHDLQIDYAIMNGRYNLSFSLNNITDARVYDNFNIQKPGRAVSVKLRYFLK